MQVNGPIVLCAAMGTFENHHHQGHSSLCVKTGGSIVKKSSSKWRIRGVTTGKYSHKKRLILDLSSPHRDDLIDKGQCSMSYIKIDDAVKIIKKYGQGTKLCKFDIQNP
jgi:hypothetical protein